MVSVNDIRMGIIQLISHIEDISQLQRIYNDVAQLETQSVKQWEAKKAPDIRDVIVEVRENVSLEQIRAEQNYPSITYEEFRRLAAKIEWEHSLKELLEAID